MELELDNDETTAIMTPDAATNYQDIYEVGKTTKIRKIQNCVVRCNIIEIDSELQNKYDDSLLKEDGGINVHYTTCHSQKKYLYRSLA